MDVEVIGRNALLRAAAEARDPYEREHVTAFLWRRPERFPAVYLDRLRDRRKLRLAVDTPEDYEFVSALYEALHGEDACFGFDRGEAFLHDRTELRGLSRWVQQRPYEFAADVRE